MDGDNPFFLCDSSEPDVRRRSSDSRDHERPFLLCVGYVRGNEEDLRWLCASSLVVCSPIFCYVSIFSYGTICIMS